MTYELTISWMHYFRCCRSFKVVYQIANAIFSAALQYSLHFYAYIILVRMRENWPASQSCRSIEKIVWCLLSLYQSAAEAVSLSRLFHVELNTISIRFRFAVTPRQSDSVVLYCIVPAVVETSAMTDVQRDAQPRSVAADQSLHPNLIRERHRPPHIVAAGAETAIRLARDSELIFISEWLQPGGPLTRHKTTTFGHH